MSNSIWNAKHFHDEATAIRYVEAGVWPKAPVCPHCGGTERIGELKGKSTRPGVRKCYDCRKPFTVKVGTIFEDSHVELKLWLQAIILIAGSKKGINSNQLHRVLGVTLKTAWFMSHRVRLAMSGNTGELMGSGGGIVEADETCTGKKPGVRKPRGGGGDRKMVLALVERGKGVRSFHVAEGRFNGIKDAIKGNVSPEAVLMTDDARWYRKIAQQLADHQTVNHSAKEYIRGEAYTNTMKTPSGAAARLLTTHTRYCLRLLRNTIPLA